MERILIIAGSERGTHIAGKLGVTNGHLRLKTKYYDTVVPVKVTRDMVEVDETVKGVVVLSLDHLLESSEWENLSDDCVKILFHDNDIHLERCIEAGFELVIATCPVGEDSKEYGHGRLLEALKCRMWESAQPVATPEVSEELMLESFDALLEKVKQVRESSVDVSDDQRRKMAEEMANQFYRLLGDDFDSLDSDHSDYLVIDVDFIP